MVGKNKERVSITFPKESLAFLDEVAAKMGKSRSEVLYMCFMYVVLDTDIVKKGEKSNNA